MIILWGSCSLRYLKLNENTTAKKKLSHFEKRCCPKGIIRVMVISRLRSHNIINKYNKTTEQELGV